MNREPCQCPEPREWFATWPRICGRCKKYNAVDLVEIEAKRLDDFLTQQHSDEVTP